ncbi:MAG: hypothetical protein ACXITV_00820 [Luteibaculaceae bacterium]
MAKSILLGILLSVCIITVKAQSAESKVESFLGKEKASILKEENPEDYKELLFLADHSAYLQQLPSEKTESYQRINHLKLKNTDKKVSVSTLDLNNFNPLLYELDELKKFGSVVFEGTSYTLTILNDLQLENVRKSSNK